MKDYLITTNNNFNQIRLFLNKVDSLMETKVDPQLLNSLKEEFQSYSETFITETLMRVNNNVKDLRSYFSDPLSNNRNIRLIQTSFGQI
jgi:hypothetical protein